MTDQLLDGRADGRFGLKVANSPQSVTPAALSAASLGRHLFDFEFIYCLNVVLQSVPLRPPDVELVSSMEDEIKS